MAKAFETLENYNDPTDSRFEQLIERAQKCSIAVEWRQVTDKSSEPWVHIQLPGGHSLDVSDENIDAALDQDFERWHGIPGLDAYYNTSESTIYASVSSSGLLHRDSFRKLGFEQSGDSDAGVREIQLQSPTTGAKVRLASSTQFPGLQFLLDRNRPSQYGLAIESVNVSSAEEAQSLLIDISNSLFFEIDCKSGLTLSLDRHREFMSTDGAAAPPTPSPLSFPRLKYDPDAVALYSYARKNTRGIINALPLVGYLAFYQVLEYFMPVYARAEVLRRLKLLLKDPRLDPDDDIAAGRLLSLATQAGREETERMQLRATLTECIDPNEILEYLDLNREAADKLADGRHITGVRIVQPKDRQTPISTQVADRVYDIRNRIVHAKDSTETAKAKTLLPASAEAKRMRCDIDLIQFLAQRVISASGRSARF